MRLGSQTNSIVNHFASRGVIGQPEPVVGMGVTFLHWTDRSAGTIYEVFKVGETQYIGVRGDHARRVDKNGMSECQDYVFEPTLTGPIAYFRIGRKGLWEGAAKNESGRWVKHDGAGLRIGSRDCYHDFSF